MATVFRARKILMLDHNRPLATHVAVRDGVFVGVGGPECGDGWGDVVRDDGYADHVMMPGLIEAHAHVSAGGTWRKTYCGHYVRTDPDGKDWPGVTDLDALIARLSDIAAQTPEGEPVGGWGFDPDFVAGRRIDRDHLDQVSTSHPVAVVHSNGQALTANSLALERAGLGRETNFEGVMRREDGEPTGELHEFAAMGPVMRVTGGGLAVATDADGVVAYGKVARACGVTTVADLLSGLHDEEVSMLERITADPAFPARYVPIMNAMVDAPKREAERAVALRARSTEKLHLGRAKLFTEGSIQAGTAMLKLPGYFAMEDRGI